MIIATSFSTYFKECGQDIDKTFEVVKKDGFGAIGISISEPIEFYLEKKEKFKNSGLIFCIHAPLVDTNISSTNQGIRTESIKQMKGAILFAKEIDAKIVTLHPGKFRNTQMIQDAYLLLDSALDDLLLFAENNDVKLCLENMEPNPKELCVTLTQVQKVFDQHPNLCLTLDLAHVAMVVTSEEEFYAYYNSLKEYIRHFHISGIKPRMSHVEVSLIESDVDFSRIIKLIKEFPGIVLIENRERSKNLESFEFIKSVLK